MTRVNPASRRLSSVRERAHSRLVTRVAYRVIVLFIGLALLAAGVGMLVLPGPGWAAIVLGLVVLASEFSWARRALVPIRTMAHRAAARAMDPAHRRRNIAIGLVAGLLTLAGAFIYISAYGIGLPR